jgi:DNA polymerase-3 subunit alpha
LSAVRSIIKSREEDGPYKSLLDFCERVDLSAVNGRVLESLTRSGSLDCFGRTRSELLELLPEAQERAAGSQKDRSAGQFSLFGEVKAESEADLPVLNRPELPQQEILKSEKQLLGIYLSGHPLNEHAQYLDLLSTASTAEIAEMDTVSGLRIGGVITGINRKTTKSGERMAILSLEDLEGEIEVVIFPEMFRNNLNLIQEEQVIVVEGDGDSRGGKHSLRASKIWSLDQAREELIRSVHLHFMDSTLDGSLLKKLKDKLISYPGQARLLLHFRLKEEDEVVISANEKYKVRPGPELIQAVSEVVTEPVLTYEVAKVSGNGRDGGNGRRGGGGYNGGRRFR